MYMSRESLQLGTKGYVCTCYVNVSKNAERSWFTMSCTRKVCLRWNFEVKGVEAERNVVQSERHSSSKRDYVHLAVISKV